MCGISGILNHKSKNENIIFDLLNKINSNLNHRGPDNTKVYKKDGVIFGSKRLSIRDLNDNANPPLLNETKDVVIVHNGEIYNTKELEIVLKKKILL